MGFRLDRGEIKMKINIQLVKDPIKTCFEYIKQNFDSIYPFQIASGYSFQIRMDESTFSVLPEKYKEELKKFVILDAYDDSIDEKVLDRYKKDFFWINANEYIFNFETKKILHLSTNCDYGPEGIEGCIEEILFADENELSPFILLNIDLDSDQKPKFPKLND